MLRISILSLIALVALLPGHATAQDRALEIREVDVYSLKDGLESRAEEFDSEQADELGLYALVIIRGLEERRTENLNLFLVVYGEDDEDRKKPLIKQKRSERFGNGEFALEFTEFMDADAWFGEETFTAVLEASLKGAKTVRFEREFTIEGPHMPDVSFDSIGVYSWERGPNYVDIRAGEEFVIDMTVIVEDNVAQLDPRLRILAIMEDDLWYFDPEDPEMTRLPNWSEALLRGTGNGQWRIHARAKMPQFFEHPYDYYHDYRIYAYVGFGEQPRYVSDYVRLEMIDPDNGELRESNDISEHLIELSAGGHWNIRQEKAFED